MVCYPGRLSPTRSRSVRGAAGSWRDPRRVRHQSTTPGRDTVYGARLRAVARGQGSKVGAGGWGRTEWLRLVVVVVVVGWGCASFRYLR
eukprot:COSAG01_NODE_6564_length_3607_cov_1.225200_2_plen_89_part_00